MEKRGLGKGLSALIPEVAREKADRISQIKVEDIRPSRNQPREDFDPGRLEELISSIKEKGIVQPVLVRPYPPSPGTSAGYELIAGARRLSAAKSLGIEEIPAIIKDVPDTEALEISLIENLQRLDLNPIEEAHGYKKLIDGFKLTQEKVARVVGKDRSSVANTLRLLKLPKKVQDSIFQGKISMGHARAILSLKSPRDQIELCGKVITGYLSVRETERLVNRKKASVVVQKRKIEKDNQILAMEEELQHILGTRVRIVQGRKRGRIQIEYYSEEDLERILDILKKNPVTRNQ